MSVISIDIGTTTTKIIEYANDEIINKEIYINKNPENVRADESHRTFNVLDDFITKNNINDLEYIVATGIGGDKIKSYKNIPVRVVEEFNAIAKGGLYLADKKEALIVSVGTGTALIRACENSIEHLGGTGVGAGTLVNLCKLIAGIDNFEEIIEYAQKGNLANIDLRIGDVTDQEIKTLPKDLTLANFAKLNPNANKEDLVLGILNMVFEVIGMMAAFSLKKDKIKDVVLIGNIVTVPRVKEILLKIEKTQGISFTIPQNASFAVAIGAIKTIEKITNH